MDDCPDCQEHPSGCCWSHKMQYWRQGGGAITVPSAFKTDMTKREKKAEIYADARAKGVDIQRAR